MPSVPSESSLVRANRLRPRLRDALLACCSTAADFDAFCIDYFPDIHRQIGPAMDLVQRLNVLLSRVNEDALLVALQQAESKSAPLIAKNPYRGLAAFQIEDADLFYGRAELVAELRRQLTTLLREQPPARILLLQGATGCGKSSLLRAGLLASLLRPSIDDLPRLRRNEIALLVPGDQPLASLALALARCTGGAVSYNEVEALLQQPNGIVSLYDRLAQNPGERSHTLVIAVDQLEELFVLCKSREQVSTLLLRLVEAAKAPRQILVLLSMREDFKRSLSAHRELNRIVSGAANNRSIFMLDRDQLTEAIRTPAAVAGHPLEPALVEQLVSEAMGPSSGQSLSPGTGHGQHSLPLIQFTLHRLWASIAAGQNGLAALREMGGIGGALDEWADVLYQLLQSADDRKRAKRLFLALVCPSDPAHSDDKSRRLTRRRRRIEELVPHGEDDGRTRELIYYFSRVRDDIQHQQGRLLSIDSEDQVMLAHETLVTSWRQLREWLEKETAQLLLLDDLDLDVREWLKENRDAPGLLWRNPKLRRLRQLRKIDEPILNRQQEDFLLASEAAERRELIRLARLSGALLVLLIGQVIGLLALVYQVRSEKQAQQKERAAKEQERAAREQEARARLQERQAKNLARSHSAAALVAQPGREIEALGLAMQAAAESGSIGPNWEGLYQVSVVLSPSQLIVAPPGSPSPPRITALAFSADGQTLAIGGCDGSVALWDVRGRRPVQSLRTGEGAADCQQGAAAVRFLRYVAAGKKLLAAGADRRVRLWDLSENSQPQGPAREFADHDGPVNAADLSPDGAEVVSASDDRSVRFFNVRSGRVVRRLPHSNVVYSARYSPSGAYVVTASRAQLIQIFDRRSDRPLLAIGPSAGSQELKDTRARTMHDSGHRGFVQWATFSQDDRRLLTAGEDNLAIVWDVASGRQLLSLAGHVGPVASIEESPNGRTLLTASADNTARIWDARGGRLLFALAGHTDHLTSAVYSPDGESVATVSRDGTARLWTPAGRPHTRIEAHSDFARSAVFSPDRAQSEILSAGADGLARIWDRKTGKLRRELLGHALWVNSAVYSPDGGQVVTAGMDCTARVWDLRSESDPSVLRSADGCHDWIRYAEFSPDGQSVVMASGDSTAYVFAKRAEGWKLASKLVHPRDSREVASAVFSRDGREILTASADHRARRWRLSDGQILQTLDHESDDWVRHAVFSPQGTMLLTASRNGLAMLWDVTSGELRSKQALRTLSGHTGWVRHAVFSADGRRVVTAGADMAARLWETASGAELLVLNGHSGQLSTAEFSRDGRYVVTAGRDGVVLVHAIDPGLLWTYGCTLLASLPGHPQTRSDEIATILARCRAKKD